MQKTPPSSIFTDRNAAIFLMGIIFIGLPICAIFLAYYFDLPTKSARHKNTIAPACRTCSYPYGKPDGELLFIYAGSLVLIDADGNETVLRDIKTNDAKWSPDGTSILFISQVDDRESIFVMEADGTNLRHLISNDLNPGFVEYSPDGKQIAFTSYSQEQSTLYVMNANGMNMSAIVSVEQNIRSPAWSPDGTQIAFVHSEEGVYVVNSDGTDLNHVSGLEANDLNWSLDGAQLLVSTLFEGDTPNLFLINAEGGIEKKFMDMQAFLGNWSPDGSKIAFTSNNGNVFIANADGSSIQQLTSSQFWEGGPVWSTDGSKIAFTCEIHDTASDSISNVCVMNADGSDIRIVSAYWQSHSPQWRP